MNTVYLLIGGNEGDRPLNLARARDMISLRCGEITNTSPVYETDAWGQRDQPAFLNQALQIETELRPLQLLHEILAIEKDIGRVRKEKYGPRLIDIDILFFNSEVYELEHLTVPHPQLQNRRFVLEPMAAIAPTLVHPVLALSIRELLLQCPDPLAVTIYDQKE